MIGSAHPRRLLPLLGVLLIATLACGLTQGLGSRQEEPTAVVESDSQTVAPESDSAAGEAASGESDLPAGQDTAQDSGADTTAEDQPVQSSALASDQVFVLPGSDPPTMDPHLSGDSTSAE